MFKMAATIRRFNNIKKNKQANKHVTAQVPKRFNFKRQHKGLTAGFQFKTSCYNVKYGNFGFKILKPLNVTEAHVKAIRNILMRKRYLKRKNNKLLIRGMFDVPVTKKPNEIRMGKGKGPFHHWILRARPGKIVFEVVGVSIYTALKIMRVIRGSLGRPFQLIKIKK